MANKTRLDSAVAAMSDKDKETLFGKIDGPSNGRRTPARSGRVLGKETERTRELDNQGVLQLQKQTMQDQDQSVEELMKIILRQRELGQAIHEELEVHNELLRLADEDTDRLVFSGNKVMKLVMLTDIYRLKAKVDVGKKRIGRIS